MTSASAGSSRRVRRKKCERRVTTRVKSREPDALTLPTLGRVRARRPRLISVEANDALIRSLAQLRMDLELPSAFPADVEAEAAGAARSVSTDPVTAGLDDLREIEFLTIDPAGSKDLDQALHLERTPTGGILH